MYDVLGMLLPPQELETQVTEGTIKFLCMPEVLKTNVQTANAQLKLKNTANVLVLCMSESPEFSMNRTMLELRMDQKADGRD